jgi:predicted DNA-binding transcriptional regulator YafY
LHRLARLLDEAPRSRAELIELLQIGLRTFYRELELLRRCGVKIRLIGKKYQLRGTLAQAETQLPFPDPRLSFAEMAELSSCQGPAARRLGGMLKRVLDQSAGKTTKRTQTRQDGAKESPPTRRGARK